MSKEEQLKRIIRRLSLTKNGSLLLNRLHALILLHDAVEALIDSYAHEIGIF